MSARSLAVVGAVLAFLAVAAGAFGAHALEARLEPEALELFRTGARYQMYHALALMAVAALAARWPDALWGVAGGLFVTGVVVFSGSLYALAATGLRWLGAVTPVGGLALLSGWLCAAVAGWRAAG